MADEFATIDLNALEDVTGGRYTKGAEQIRPELIQAIGELAKAVSGVGQGLAAAKQQSDGQLMQMIPQRMQARGRSQLGLGPRCTQLTSVRTGTQPQSSSLRGNPSCRGSAAGALSSKRSTPVSSR